jgi:UDP-N-acetylglucosamine--N-acetylmuramyl-(pentapeptide) pyrophosphoryl-undecaprenol N-acetylglucosamine transferase
MTAVPSVIFAGGGSGGHLAPGLAIDERLREIAPGAKSIFLCSNRSIDATMLGEAGAHFVALPATPPSRHPLAVVRFIRNFWRSQRLASEIIARERPTCVVALGGFVAAPIAKAAWRRGVPVLLVNLDAPPGKSNRWLARYCQTIVSAVELPTLPGFASRVVGYPVRRRAIAPAAASECRLRLNLQPDVPVLLVTGASQGASSINAMMLELARRSREAFSGWQVLHLAGQGADEALRLGYSQAGVRAVVVPFLHEMGLAWGSADLAISRAGANSVAEIATNAVPAIFLPYPHHKDMHQRQNAHPLVRDGGAVIHDDAIDPSVNAESLVPLLRSLMSDALLRQQMRHALRRRVHHDAALTIAQMLA